MEGALRQVLGSSRGSGEADFYVNGPEKLGR